MAEKIPILYIVMYESQCKVCSLLSGFIYCHGDYTLLYIYYIFYKRIYEHH